MSITQTIKNLPDPPLSIEPDNFDVKADTFFVAIPDLPNQVNSLSLQVNQVQTQISDNRSMLEDLASQFTTGDQAFKATSNSSNIISKGSKIFILNEINRAFGVGSIIRVLSQANPEENFMDGIVTAYLGNRLTINITQISGSGIYNDWEMGYIASLEDTTNELAFLDKSDWQDNKEISISLEHLADGVGNVNVSVYEEQSQLNKTNNKWNIEPDGPKFSLKDYAKNASLTPSEMNGENVTFTLGSGIWEDEDIGKQIINLSSGQPGKGIIMSINGDSTCQVYITEEFSDVTSIESGDWKLYAVMFTQDGTITLSGLNLAYNKEDYDSIAKRLTDLTQGHVYWASKLSETKFIILAYDSTTYYAIVISYDEETDSYTVGTPFDLSISGSDGYSIIGLNDNLAVFFYSTSDVGYYNVLSITDNEVTAISGDTIFCGSENSASCVYALCKCSDNSILVGYQGYSSRDGYYRAVKLFTIDLNTLAVTNSSEYILPTYGYADYSKGASSNNNALWMIGCSGESKLLLVPVSVSGIELDDLPENVFGDIYEITNVNCAINRMDIDHIRSEDESSKQVFVITYRSTSSTIYAQTIVTQGTESIIGTQITLQNAAGSIAAAVTRISDTLVMIGHTISGAGNKYVYTVTKDYELLYAFHDEFDASCTYLTLFPLGSQIISAYTSSSQIALRRVGTQKPTPPISFYSSDLTYHKTVAIDENKAFCIFSPSTSSYMYCSIISYNNTTQKVEYRTPLKITSEATTHLSLAKISDTKIISCYIKATKVCATVFTINGSIIRSSTEQELTTVTSLYSHVAMLTDTTGVLLYVDTYNSYTMLCRFSISGTTITVESIYTYATVILNDLYLAHWSDNKVILLYNDGTNSYAALISNTSGTDLDFGDAVTFSENTTAFTQAVPLTDTDGVILYSIDDENNYGQVCKISNTTGLTLSAGTQVTFVEKEIGYDMSITKVSDTTAMVTYREMDDNLTHYQYIFMSPFPMLVYSPNYPLEENETNVHQIVKISPSKCLFTYSDTSLTDGRARIIRLNLVKYTQDQYISAITNKSGQINTEAYTDFNSISIDDDSNSQLICYALSTNNKKSFWIVKHGQTPVKRLIASSLNSDHGNTDGQWYINSSDSHGSCTWELALDQSNLHSIIEEAIAETEVNIMESLDAVSVPDSELPEFENRFDVAIILFSDDSLYTPACASIIFNYDQDLTYKLKTYNYTISTRSNDLVTIKAPSEGVTRNAKVYITK